MALTEGGGYLGEGTGYVLIAGPMYCKAPQHHTAELSESRERWNQFRNQSVKFLGHRHK